MLDSQEQEETEGRDDLDEITFIIASPKGRALQGTRPKAISSTKSLRKQQKIDALKKALAMKALPGSTSEVDSQEPNITREQEDITEERSETEGRDDFDETAFIVTSPKGKKVKGPWSRRARTLNSYFHFR